MKSLITIDIGRYKCGNLLFSCNLYPLFEYHKDDTLPIPLSCFSACHNQDKGWTILVQFLIVIFRQTSLLMTKKFLKSPKPT